MPTTDLNTFIGPYPFRFIPHPDPDVLVRVLDHEGIDEAWVGHLPSVFYRDPTPGNAQLLRALRTFASGIRSMSPATSLRPLCARWHAPETRCASSSPRPGATSSKRFIGD